MCHSGPHASGHDGGAGGGALCFGVVVCETDAFRRQLVQAGRGIEGAIAAQVTPAGVVDQHEYDIWFVRHFVLSPF